MMQLTNQRHMMEAIAMPQLSLEQRVAALERQWAEMQLSKTNGPAKNDWRQTVGMFTDDPGMLELFSDAMKIREADRQKARRRSRQTRRVKS
jgi:hypothetical protein